MLVLLALACTLPSADPTALRLDARGAQVGAVHLGTTGFGRSAIDRVEPVAPVDDACAWRDPAGACVAASIQASGVRTWWRERPDGLQQGWVIDVAPAGEGPIRIAVGVQGATVSSFGDDLALVDAAGTRWWYGGLQAWDAGGRPLPGRLDATADGLVVTVDDTAARYPITVDPVLSTSFDVVEGTEDWGYFGDYAVGGFDLDADGYTDLFGYAPHAASYNGMGLLFMGSASGYPTAPDRTWTNGGSESGRGAIATAGDVDDDGYDDLLLGDRVHAVELFYGSAAGVPTDADVTLSSPVAGGGFSAGLVTADVDLDSDHEIFVGAPTAVTPGVAGAVYVYDAGSLGTSPVPDLTLTGASGGDRFGAAVSAGDVDGDGDADLLVGAPGDDGEGTNAGAVFVYCGSEDGLGTTPCATFRDGPAGSEFGREVRFVGDLDGDGLGDFVVGAPLDDGAASDAGAAYVYLGHATAHGALDAKLLGGTVDGLAGTSVTPAGDVDADGLADFVVGCAWHSGCNYVLYRGDASLHGDAPAQVFGPNSVGSAAFAGDVDHDGFDDLATGAPLAGATGPGRGMIVVRLGFVDADGDGHGGGGGDTSDCDDDDDAVHPGATELPDDGVDSDCDTMELCLADLDGDGFVDGSGATVSSADLACDGAGEATAAAPEGDCDDASASVNPDATELTGDEVDQDCDGTVLCWPDGDIDGYRTDTRTVSSIDADCDDLGEALTSAPDGDCDDAAADVNPGATEVAGDGVDGDCDRTELCFSDADDDGYRSLSGTTISSDPDCDDPGEALASDPAGDCDDAAAAVHPDGVEVCNAVDDDCDGDVDVGATDTETWYADADGDGSTSATDTVTACEPPTGYRAASTAEDCDDADADVHPDAREVAGNGIDEDCDGVDPDIDAIPDDTGTDVAQGGCGCENAGGGGASLGLLGLAVLGLTRRSRRR